MRRRETLDRLLPALDAPDPKVRALALGDLGAHARVGVRGRAARAQIDRAFAAVSWPERVPGSGDDGDAG